MNANDRQVGGDHYQKTVIQPWEVIEAWGLGFFDGNVIKYIYRAGRKDGNPAIVDYKKAQHYMDKCVEIELKGVKNE